jgi:hypothetical protein
MAIVSNVQVSFARRCVDSLVSDMNTFIPDDISFRENDDVSVYSADDDNISQNNNVGALNPHVVFLLHLGQEIAFRPIYTTSCFEWQAIFVDDWGLGVNDKAENDEDGADKDFTNIQKSDDNALTLRLNPQPFSVLK